MHCAPSLDKYTGDPLASGGYSDVYWRRFGAQLKNTGQIIKVTPIAPLDSIVEGTYAPQDVSYLGKNKIQVGSQQIHLADNEMLHYLSAQYETNLLPRTRHSGRIVKQLDARFGSLMRMAKKPKWYGSTWEQVPWLCGTSIQQYIPGTTLTAAQDAFSLYDVFDTSFQVLKIMRACHGGGYFHNDLKPDNIMRSPSGKLTGIDLGISRPFGKYHDLFPGESLYLHENNPVDSHLTGTLRYMSPESLVGDRFSVKADHYAFATIFYELSTGHEVIPGSESLPPLQLLGLKMNPTKHNMTAIQERFYASPRLEALLPQHRDDLCDALAEALAFYAADRSISKLTQAIHTVLTDPKTIDLYKSTQLEPYAQLVENTTQATSPLYQAGQPLLLDRRSDQ